VQYSRITKEIQLAIHSAMHNITAGIHLLGANKTCPNCSQSMQWEARAGISDKFSWRCPCRKRYPSQTVAFSPSPTTSGAMGHLVILVGEGVPCNGSYGRSKRVKINGHRCILMVS